jgi:RNA polymerase sigma factor (sigma-70 family)
VSKHAYLPLDDLPLYISDGSVCRERAVARAPSEWADDEIVAIRAALKKIAAGRILDPSDAEDLVQETLLTLIAKCPRDQLRKSPLVWSMGVFRRKVGNYYRRSRRTTSLEDWESGRGRPSPELGLSPAPASPETSLLHAEVLRIIEETVSRLPASQRRAMEMLISGLNPGEIVDRLDPERYQNVINRLHRGRRRLAAELARYGLGPEGRTGMRKMKRSLGKRRR